MKLIIRNTCYDDFDLIDTIMDYKMDSSDFKNNQTIVKKISEYIDKIRRCKYGHQLFTVTNGTESKLILICKSKSISEKTYYKVYGWEKKESIDKKLTFTMNDEQYNKDIYSEIKELVESAKLINNTYESRGEYIKYCISDSLKGYVINTKKIAEIAKFIKQKRENKIIHNQYEFRDEYNDEYDIIKTIRENTHNIYQNIIKQVENFSTKLKCDKLKIAGRQTELDNSTIYIAKITDVLKVGNRRYYKITICTTYKNEKNTHIRETISYSDPEETGNLSIANMGPLFVHCHRRYTYDDFDIVSLLSRIPHNLIDKGRYIITTQRTHSYDVIFASDPRVNPDYMNELKNVLYKYQDTMIKKGMNFDDTNIEDGDLKYVLSNFIGTVDVNETNPTATIMKAIKKMVDEYHYIAKKQKSTGEDIFITDKIQFNHDKGSVKYNDFSISIDDEMVKSRLYNYFSTALVNFYRGTVTEQEILDNILVSIFDRINDRIYYVAKEDMEMNIVINDNVNIKIEEKLSSNGKSKLTYINGQRFNKNEVIIILKEMTCYRDQETADMFIKTIGKIGLSTYIGISTGYVIKNKMMKFKKGSGRSNYTLMLDDIEIPIKGKKIISALYSDFINEKRLDNRRLNKIINESITNTENYLKYKFLIDSSYEEFKKKSKAFLDKKVNDTGSLHAKYLNKKTNKYMDAIIVNGLSGTQYVIAYDNKDSFVFMNPDKDDKKLHGLELDVYKNGNYICMIDQSNIKSNIGYDTVISKLLALRNDSIIAEQIYNLKDELDTKGEK